MERQISATKAYEESEDVGRNPSENPTRAMTEFR
jgi:hypothetical protein